jgi:hypothetical protein
MIIVFFLPYLWAYLSANRGCIDGSCPVQYQPNNVDATPLQFIDFTSGAPWFLNANASAPTGNLNTYIYYGTGNNASTTVGNILPFYGVVQSQTLAPLAFQSEAPFALPLWGTLEARAAFSFEAAYLSGSVDSPLGWEEDPVYASATFGLRGGTSAVTYTFAFVVTNKMIYARYSRAPGSPTDGYTFDYLIPIARRSPEDISTYAVVLDDQKQSASWRVDDKELLYISPAGTTIDPKFEIGGTLGTGLGTAMSGAYYLIFGNPQINPATQNPCQGTVFRQCAESIEFARLARCKRAPTVDPLASNFLMTSVYRSIQVVQWAITPGCPVEPYCAARPVTCPRQVRRRESYSFGLPEPPTPPTPPTPPSPPIPPFDCGCGLDKKA